MTASGEWSSTSADWAHRAAAYRTTAIYSGLLATGTVVLAGLPTSARGAWLQWASTNLDNLRHHPLPALVGSAFLPGDHAVLWVTLALIGLGCTERRLGSARTAALAAAGHVTGTAISEGILAYRVFAGDLPAADRRIIDVGPSFVVVTGLLAAVAVGPLVARLIAGVSAAVIAPSLLEGITRLDVAAVGHCAAMATGLVGGWAIRRRQQSVAAQVDEITAARPQSSDNST